MFGFLRRKKAKGKAVGADRGVPEVAEIDPNSPFGHNQRLFDKLHRAIDEGSLPEMSRPSKRDIAECEERRREQLERAQAAYDAEEEHEPWGAIYSLERVKANQEIPVEVELWVEAVCDRYLRRAKPMVGLGGWEQNVRKKLYSTRGYEWYAVAEIYPMTTFD